MGANPKPQMVKIVFQGGSGTVVSPVANCLATLCLLTSACLSVPEN